MASGGAEAGVDNSVRVAEVLEQDMAIENGKVSAYRVKLKVSFKYRTD